MSSNPTTPAAPMVYPSMPKMDGMHFRLHKGQSIPQLKDDDPDYMKPKPVADAHVRVFNMGDPQDVDDYAAVWDEAAKGHIMISAEERHWSEAIQNFKIFLRWGDMYLELPRHEVPHAQRQFN